MSKIAIIGFNFNHLIEMTDKLPVDTWIRWDNDPHSFSREADKHTEKHSILVYDNLPLKYGRIDVIQPNRETDPILASIIHDHSNYYFRYYSRLNSEHISFSRTRLWTHMENHMWKMLRFYADWIHSRNIDTLIFSNFPHEGSFVLLHLLARKTGLKVIITAQSVIPKRFWALRDFDYLSSQNFSRENLFSTLEGQEKIELPKVVVQPYMKRGLQTGYKRSLQKLESIFKLFMRTLFLFWIFNRKKFSKTVHQFVRNFDPLSPGIKGNCNPETMTEQFVYFPLHLQPEMTTDTLGGPYGDQAFALEALSHWLPRDVKIVIKENPKQKSLTRESDFWNRVRKIPNLLIAPESYPSFDLIKKSLFTATITGTAGWEAIRLGKKAVVFGDAWYLSLEGTFSFSEIQNQDFNEFISRHVDEDKLKRDFNELGVKLLPGIVDNLYERFSHDFNPKQNRESVSQTLIQIINS